VPTVTDDHLVLILLFPSILLELVRSFLENLVKEKTSEHYKTKVCTYAGLLCIKTEMAGQLAMKSSINGQLDLGRPC